MENFFDEERESIVAYYILPLVRLSFKAFGVYYINCKLSRNLKEVIVYVLPLCTEEFWKNENYKTDYTENCTTYIVYAIPDRFLNDVKLFSEGKYSRMSNEAKSMIYKHSGLKFNYKLGDFHITDKKLLVLTKNRHLRKWLTDQGILEEPIRQEYIVLKNKDIIYE